MKRSKGRLIVLSAPSGSGKTTIARAIMQNHPSIMFSVSATTRSKRSGEHHGKDYYFLSRDEFDRRIKAGELVEWEEIYGDLYGTLKSEIDGALSAGRVMLFDVDVKGAASIKRHYPEALVIFINPPSVESLKQRLTGRKTENESALGKRLERVPMELELGTKFEHQVVNDDLPHAIAQVEEILAKHAELEPIHSS